MNLRVILHFSTFFIPERGGRPQCALGKMNIIGTGEQYFGCNTPVNEILYR